MFEIIIQDYISSDNAQYAFEHLEAVICSSHLVE